MKNIYLSCLLFIWLYSGHAWAQAKTLSLAYLEAGLKAINDTDKQIALQILAQELTKNTDVELSVFPLNSMQEMLEFAKAGKLNYSLINSYFYIKDIESLRPFLVDEIWAAQRGQQLEEDYVFIVSKDTEYRDIKSLSGKRLSIYEDDLLMGFYLQQLLKKELHTSPGVFFKSIKDTRTLSQAVLDVFFKTSDVCLVPNFILELVVELNPAVSQGIKTVHHSGAHFIPALLLVFKGNPQAEADAIRNNLLKLSDSVRGQQILDLFNIKTITRIQKESLNIMLNLDREQQESLQE